jgi:hypothetical protein
MPAGAPHTRGLGRGFRARPEGRVLEPIPVTRGLRGTVVGVGTLPVPRTTKEETMETREAPIQSTELKTSTRPWHWISSVATLAVLVLGLGIMLFFSRQSLGSEKDRANGLRQELTASEEEVTGLSANVTELESTVNGLRISTAEFEARAQTCITGLEDAIDAVYDPFAVEDWGTFYDRYGDVERTCRNVLSGSIIGLI